MTVTFIADVQQNEIEITASNTSATIYLSVSISPL